jgi:hypothetical protein
MLLRARTNLGAMRDTGNAKIRKRAMPPMTQVVARERHPSQLQA